MHPGSSASNHAWNPPAEFDGFTLRQPLGAGGMGRVYLAYEAALDRLVAVKFITAAAPGRAARDRFLIEARAIARLQHPNVVAIHRIGQVDGRPYLASEYVAGTGLDRLEKPVPWSRALEIGVAVLRGLAAAHQRGVLHRDIKPANVIEAVDGTVKLLDFGLARLDEPMTGETAAPLAQSSAPSPAETTLEGEAGLPWQLDADAPGPLPGTSQTLPAADAHAPGHGATITGALLGTPLFLAPELWSGERATPRSDVYAAGLILFELCAGSLPFADLSGEALARHVREVGLPALGTLRPDVPRPFANLVDRAVSRNPEHRYASAVDLLDALDAVHSVFQSFRRVAPGAADDDASVVSASYARVSADADAFFIAVYEQLFASEPALRALFPVDLTEQRVKLASTIRLAVESLRSPERLVAVLEDLGRRHVAYGVRPDQLTLFGATLIQCLARFEGTAWTERTEQAWERAYEAIAGAMRRGMLEGG